MYAKRTRTVSASHYPARGERTVVVTDAGRTGWVVVGSQAEYEYFFSSVTGQMRWRGATPAPQATCIVLPGSSSTADPRLQGVIGLKNNWDGYGAEAPNQTARLNAENALNLVDKCPILPARITPSAEGGVSIVFAGSGRLATLEFLNSGEILLSLAGSQAEPEVAEITLPFVDTAIDRICAHLG